MPVSFLVVDDVLLLTILVPTQVALIVILTELPNEVIESIMVVDGEGDAVDVIGNATADGGIVHLPVSVDMLGQDADEGGGDDFVAHGYDDRGWEARVKRQSAGGEPV
jgi:hypothetical protein